MSAAESTSPDQFNFVHFNPETGGSTRHQQIRETNSGASMIWNSREVKNITVPPDYQRKGVATALWNEGHRLAESSPKIPAPKHSRDRTNAGDAWAKTVGGRLPRRKAF